MSAAKKMPEFIQLEDAAKVCGCSPRHLQEEIKRGNLRAYKPGRRVLFMPEDLEKWIKRKAMG